MSEPKKLSLASAILININIMMGVGIFINTVVLSKQNGIIGAFLYPFMGLLIAPLIVSIAELIKLHPAGGFYSFGKAEIGSWAGFIAAWSYFTGKLASAMLMIHVSVSLLQQIIPSLAAFNIYALDAIVLSLFIALNMLNVRTGSFIQMGFLGLKLIPVLSVIFLSLWYFDISIISHEPIIWQGVLPSLPLVLYAAMGFEATCSLSSNIRDAAINGPKAIYYSCLISMGLIFLFQAGFYVLLAHHLNGITGYLDAFPALFNSLGLPLTLIPYLIVLMHTAIACSALGGSYGILYSNSWNLYTLAQHGHVFARNWFMVLSRWGIPICCVAVEGVVCLSFLAITGGAAIPLQQVSAISSLVAYTISVIALIIAHRRHATKLSTVIPVLGMGSCALLLGVCIRNFLLSGRMGSLMLFTGIMVAGLCMFFIRSKKLSNLECN